MKLKAYLVKVTVTHSWDTIVSGASEEDAKNSAVECMDEIVENLDMSIKPKDLSPRAIKLKVVSELGPDDSRPPGWDNDCIAWNPLRGDAPDLAEIFELDQWAPGAWCYPHERMISECDADDVECTTVTEDESSHRLAKKVHALHQQLKTVK